MEFCFSILRCGFMLLVLQFKFSALHHTKDKQQERAGLILYNARLKPVSEKGS
jgi:hypothetical protein